MTDSEDGSSKQDIRESCEREDEIVSEKSRSQYQGQGQHQGQGDQGAVAAQPRTSNVDVGGAAQLTDGEECEGNVANHSSVSNTNPASPR